MRGVGGTWDNYFALRGVRAENEPCASRSLSSRSGSRSSGRSRLRAERLQATARACARARNLPTLAAEVIAGNPNPGLLTVTVDRGTADGVQADMAVIAPKGVVGRVIGPVASHAARVQLIIDRNAAVGAVSERTRVGGMVVGVDGRSAARHGARVEPGRRRGR